MNSKNIFYPILLFATMIIIGILAYFIFYKEAVLPIGGSKIESEKSTILPKQVTSSGGVPFPKINGQTETTSSPSTPQPPPPSPTPVPTPPPKLEPLLHKVFIESGGFNPQHITIRVGDTVRWVNNDDELHWPASDPHPTHTGVPDFDPLADLLPGENFSYTFSMMGAFPYHDHTQAVIDDVATIVGAIIVLENE